MPKLLQRDWSIVSILGFTSGGLAVCYLALIAAVMSYAALEVEFSQSVRSDEASVATLEGQYLASVQALTSTNYATLGYAKPSSLVYVPAAPQAVVTIR